MRILFLTPRFPYPPLKGDTLRAYHQIRALHEAGNTITLLSLADAPVSHADMAEMQALCDRIEVVHLPKSRAMLNMGFGLFNARPLQVSHYISGEFRRLLAHTLNAYRFDAIHVALIRMLPYVWDLPSTHPPVTVDLIDSLGLNLEDRRKSTRGPLRLAYELEYRRVLRYERESVRRFDALAVSSPADKQALGGHGNIAVIPNGVDLDRFPFDPERDGTDESIIFTGNMGYGPNEEAVLWFAAEVWPLLRQSHPQLRFRIAGINPSERVMALANIAGIDVLGKVPDVALCLREATIAVAPMRSGSGIQNKVLEAMSSGTPVVSTSIGNRGVGAQHNAHLLVADTGTAFAQSIETLLQSPGKRSQMAQQARRYVESRFQWSEHANALLGLYKAHPQSQADSFAPEQRHKLNVMQLTDVTGRGGAEKALADIALHLDPERFNVSVCATREAGNYQPLLDEAGIRTFIQGRKSRWDLGQWLKLIRLLKRERIDILHTHLFGSNTLGRLLGKAAGVPVIISHDHWSTISAREARVDRLLHTLSDRILVPSEASRTLVSQVEGIANSRIDVLYNGVDTAKFAPATPEEQASVRREFGIADDAFVIGMLGRLSPEKGGVDLLLKAVYRLAQSQPNVRLLIVGDGPLRPELEALDATLNTQYGLPGAQTLVTFAGTRQDTPRLLGAMNLFVLPSLNEALPIVALEAMSVGLPVLATRVGGVPEIIEDGANGLLVQPGDEPLLFAVLTQMVNDLHLRSRLARAGQERVRKDFTIESMARRVEAIYEQQYARKVGEKRKTALVTRHSL